MGWKQTSDSPDYAARSLVDRAVALEILEPSLRKNIDLTVAASNSPETWEKSALIAEIKKGARRSSTTLMAPAIQQLQGPIIPAAVWAKLCEMAETGDYPDLKLEDEKLLTLTSGHLWQELSQSAVGQALSRYRKKVSQREREAR